MKRSMNIKLSLIFAACGFFALTTALQARVKPYVGTPQFERMKKLAGRWAGQNPSKPGEKVFVEYQVQSNGQLLEEKDFTGTAKEMRSVYSEKDGKISFLHSGPYPNRHRLEFRFARDDEFIFMLAVGSGVPPYDLHLHEFTVTFLDDDSIIQRWNVYHQGTRKEEIALNLARVREPAPAIKIMKPAEKIEVIENVLPRAKVPEVKEVKSVPGIMPSAKPEGPSNKFLDALKKPYRMIMGEEEPKKAPETIKIEKPREPETMKSAKPQEPRKPAKIEERKVKKDGGGVPVHKKILGGLKKMYHAVLGE